MRILALQLKRIGDLVLTTPALAALRRAYPRAHLALAVHESTAGLLPAIPSIDTSIVVGPSRGWTPWQQALTGGFRMVLDFTGSDRSALLARLSRAERRVTYAHAKNPVWRRWMFHEEVISPVREAHTVDHYLRLTSAVISPAPAPALAPALPELQLPEKSIRETRQLREAAGQRGPFALVHAGTARPEKYWLADRWAAVIHHLQQRWQLPCVVTGGFDAAEHAHLSAILAKVDSRVVNLAGKLDLLGLAATVADAHVVLSVDTAVVHLASAFQRPQVSLFGPTNPFHWRPRHAASVVLSAASPEAPLTEWMPRLRGAPMEQLSTDAVTRATDALLLHHPVPPS